mmetsp:Transcript_4137/g.12194  ORF Transcript_4137/g.12194 Transcript_4137/m.12194 type:complete len:240 (-) Transcript_4137:1034-1753(-)
MGHDGPGHLDGWSLRWWGGCHLGGCRKRRARRGHVAWKSRRNYYSGEGGRRERLCVGPGRSWQGSQVQCRRREGPGYLSSPQWHPGVRCVRQHAMGGQVLRRKLLNLLQKNLEAIAGLNRVIERGGRRWDVGRGVRNGVRAKLVDVLSHFGRRPHEIPWRDCLAWRAFPGNRGCRRLGGQRLQEMWVVSHTRDKLPCQVTSSSVVAALKCINQVQGLHRAHCVEGPEEGLQLLPYGNRG